MDTDNRQELHFAKAVQPTSEVVDTLTSSVKLSLGIGWALYIPFAIFILMISGMAGDDPYANHSNVLLGMLLLNGLPLLLMIVLTYLSIKKNIKLTTYLGLVISFLRTLFTFIK